MPSETIVIAANICQAAVPFISLLAYVPQWTKLCRSRSSDSISISSWCAWTISSAFALFYAVVQLILNERGWALVLTTLLGLLFVAFTLILVIRFRPRHPAKPFNQNGGIPNTEQPTHEDTPPTINLPLENKRSLFFLPANPVQHLPHLVVLKNSINEMVFAWKINQRNPYQHGQQTLPRENQH